MERPRLTPMGFPIAVVKPLQGDRLRDLSMLFGLVLWLAYTRLFFILQAGHMTLPPCPFYLLTGHPCPFCGGTRSFAYMWQGDMADAVRLFPLGPVLFAGTVGAVGGLTALVASGRTWTPRLTQRQWRLLAIGAVAVIAISWALKVFVLGN